MSSSGVSNRAARQTYHPNGHGVSEGLLRARKPFRTTNAFTGALIAGFALSVYFYSIRAVAQDDFSDIAAPSESERRGVRSLEDEARLRDELKKDRSLFKSGAGAATGPTPAQLEAEQASRTLDRMGGAGARAGPTSELDRDVARAKGAVERSGMTLWERMAGSFGGKGTDSAIVYGAPPVDRLGRIGDTSVASTEPSSRRLV